ncbi:MAG: 1-(5-phosphoribosyl)-5-[(5-phosphoribosylamino)methylideneamino]imidazole-4-carboxamide isomerase [Alphaproteobacteria bacterium]|nr:1-(5-phosphoribosyl)-5-[(5-phosphoribosylamino)methylideneamino]imidazole-4-carboxamide isomerase [Alphaproteobacteria bacterium]
MSFALYPAIDLKGGECVRLLRGDLGQATVYNRDPADQARRFRALGFGLLHVVDLDGAVAGAARNAASVKAILAATDAKLQLGGGIRDRAAIETWLGLGVARVVLGTAALRNPELVTQACRAWPGRIVAGIDARGGKVAVDGWTATTDVAAVDLALRLEDRGAAAVVFTDIDRDGALGGVNLDSTAALARRLKIPVIASGGVAALADLERLKADGRIAGAIVGRAFYDGRIAPEAALRAVARC